MFSVPSQLRKTSEKFVKILEQMKTRDLAQLRVFTYLLSNSPKPVRLTEFLPGYDGTENMFYFLNITFLASYICHYIAFENIYLNALAAKYELSSTES